MRLTTQVIRRCSDATILLLVMIIFIWDIFEITVIVQRVFVVLVRWCRSPANRELEFILGPNQTPRVMRATLHVIDRVKVVRRRRRHGSNRRISRHAARCLPLGVKLELHNRDRVPVVVAVQCIVVPVAEYGHGLAWLVKGTRGR